MIKAVRGYFVNIENLVFKELNFKKNKAIVDFSIIEKIKSENGIIEKKVKFTISQEVANYLNIKSKDRLKISYNEDGKAYKLEKGDGLNSIAVNKSKTKVGTFNSSWRIAPVNFGENILRKQPSKKVSDDRTIYNKDYVVVFVP